MIFHYATVCGAPRDHGSFKRMIVHGNDMKKRFPELRFILQNIPYVEGSSTEVRGLLTEGVELRGLLPEKVERYIRERGLYGAG